MAVYEDGSKSFRPDIRKRAKWKILRVIYSAIYGEVNVSVSVCVEIKGDCTEKYQSEVSVSLSVYVEIKRDCIENSKVRLMYRYRYVLK
jgi:hypothetical protein